MRVVGIPLQADDNRRCAGPDLGWSADMADDWDDQEASRESRRQRRREAREQRRSQREAGREGRRTPPRREEAAYRLARRRANLKLSFVWHLISYATVCFFLLMVAGFRAAFVVALAWGIGLVMHYFAAIVAPDLRRRLIDSEVSREIATSRPEARRSLEDEHARSLEQLAAGVAHEIRNPITAAKSLVQQMGEDPSSRENVAYANVALEELDRVERSISHLLKFAREEEMHVGALRVAELVESALETFRDRITRLGVTVTRELGGEGVMAGDAEKLRRVLINLTGNALDALEQARTPSPRIQVISGEDLAGREVWLRVRDNGPGIAPEMLSRIFSPFYTSKDSGTGLGLAISKKLVDAHGGSIEVESTPGRGTEFLLTFPKHAVSDRVPSR
jgi:polar amino acid transport system substrate-binding protein